MKKARERWKTARKTQEENLESSSEMVLKEVLYTKSVTFWCTASKDVKSQMDLNLKPALKSRTSFEMKKL